MNKFRVSKCVLKMWGKARTTQTVCYRAHCSMRLSGANWKTAVFCFDIFTLLTHLLYTVKNVVLYQDNWVLHIQIILWNYMQMGNTMILYMHCWHVFLVVIYLKNVVHLPYSVGCSHCSHYVVHKQDEIEQYWTHCESIL